MTVEELSGKVELDQAVLSGDGGVADGFLWALEDVNAYGTMYVADPSASPRLTRIDAYTSMRSTSAPKAELLAKKFKDPHLTLTPFVGAFVELAKSRKADEP
jgi:hypothetical protein